MRIAKWQALGNDYLIVERANVPFPLTPARVQRLCNRHTGAGSDGLLELSPPQEPGFVANLRIFNPDGTEAELSGNGAREAILYLVRNGWTDARQFSIQTAAGEIRPTILSETECRVDMGRATLGQTGTTTNGFAFQHLRIGNPQTAIHLTTPADVDALDLQQLGPPIETDARFPDRTNVSFYAPLGGDAIRARIFERGVGETMSSGTGACGAAIAHVLRGGESPVMVQLDGGTLTVDVDEALHVDLTGWAVPVYEGTLSDDLVAELAAL